MDISIYVQFPVLMDVICETSVSSFDERVFSSACLGLPRVGLRIGLGCYWYCHRGGEDWHHSAQVGWVSWLVAWQKLASQIPNLTLYIVQVGG